MSGHGTNPFFFNKKINIGRPEHPLPPTTTLRPKTFYFCLTPSPRLKWMSYVYLYHPLPTLKFQIVGGLNKRGAGVEF